MIYAMMVEKKVRRTFEAINDGNYGAMLDGLAGNFTYHFHGKHALGGRRRTRTSMEAWWQRVFRLLPGAIFDVREVFVSGGPWRTRVVVNSRVQGDLPDGSTYRNTVLQLMTLRWGKVVDVETLEDLQELERALNVVFDYGNPEARAEPIEDGL
ncbi:nuclear transport factor 2 family protein [Kocuria sp. JC486]|uniref:nuclear transport factor 2 family protein n=1 Tax=Kocuria sp. JC486 TaxID=1970736 RepID=UPI00141DBC2A|nr:nuclear transport factor 2 family protein [Kocuria sp. JC486]NHU84887.1 nuclear transport factor 2 family protein [Kocuria sp. JC486]